MSGLASGMALVAVCGLAAWAGAVWVRGRARRLGLVAAPDHRSSHQVPTPRGGGIAIALAATAAFAVLALRGDAHATMLWWAAGPCAAFAVLGFLDDLRPVPVPARLAVQALLAALLVAALPPLAGAEPFAWPAAPAGLLLAAVWFAGLWWINLFNFMDGTDGFAGLEAAFVLAGAALVGVLAHPQGADAALMLAMLCAAAAAAGFLLVNWPPASIFMGDAGSLFLGAAVLALALATARSGWIGLPVWIILAMAFVCDATVTLVRRAWRGDDVFEAHRTHAYQRLARRWGSHAPVLYLLVAIDVAWLAPLALAAAIWVDFAWPIVLVAAMPLGAGALYVGAGLPDDR
jgi:Fuc2NAc and GlcNAc transferase